MKTHVYLMPGLGASSKIFDYIALPSDTYVLHYLEWVIPKSENESIQEISERLCESISEKNCVLIGVSFGGIMVQEMSRIVNPQKTIIISSIKSSLELPKRLRIPKITKAYKLFPDKTISAIANFIENTFPTIAKKKVEQFNMYLSVRDPLYLRWAVYNVLHWTESEPVSNLYHIHGTNDEIFPSKHISNYIKIKNGTHAMILNKAKKINEILLKILSESV
ncbi:alpha/beta hydrolase [Urechidicola vernalis]|uniref:Alpha/beta hydrolase n=1 Tax=Urechidicola vernalis TaxID=3075600 RepID=A0ABU2Y1Z0_9FLAO|nr:alpha/beta hydrolase [Urechidicola sp. P050]MDT0552218.1 alpha/beta hydrolase [Urechidicola sp. P050]